MVNHLLSTVASAGIDRVVVVVSPDMSDVTGALGKADIAVQEQALGTGHAAQCAMASLEGFDGTILILFGADPLISTTTLERLIAARRGADAPPLVVLGFRPTDSAQYGRLVVNDAGQLERIVEYWDADEATRAINLCNSGAVAADATTLAALLACLGNDNAKGEYYLTDIVGLARQDGAQCTVVEGDPDELVGIDTREDLARAEAGFQPRLVERRWRVGPRLLTRRPCGSVLTPRSGRCHCGADVFLGPGSRSATCFDKSIQSS